LGQCVHRSLWVLFCGLGGLFLCILPMYLGALFAFRFFNEVFLTY